MKSSEKVIEFLKTIIPLEVAKNNKKVYHSKICPICKYESRKSYIFQYQSKLKVGKCFYCGRSFKELTWLKAQLKDPNHARRVELKYGHDPFLTKEQCLYFLKKLDENSEDKMDEKDGGFVKSDDLDLPF